MSHHTPERDPYSEFEEEGIPDLQDGTPQQQWAVDPQQQPLPADHPVAIDGFGTTVEEQIEGEPLDQRVDHEVPEDQAMFGRQGKPAAQPARQTRPERDDDPGVLTAESGLGPGADLDTEFDPGPGTGAEWQAQPEEPSGQIGDVPRPAGRLVAPDEGAHPDEEADAVAGEVGPDAGGYTAEEAAMHVRE